MSSTTTQTSINVPKSMLAEARDRWPATRDMSTGRVLRFALALAVGRSEDEAVAATRDARIGTTRERKTAPA